jgi:tubulin-specific chaperone A
VIGIIFSLILSNQIIYSLNKLKEGIDIISKGNLEHQIKIKTKDEVAEFLHKFNNMTKMLKTTLESKRKAYEEITIINRNLELIVEDRTQELNKINSELIDKNNELQELNIQLENNIEDRQIAFEELERMNEEFERTNVELETANAKLLDINLERDKAYKSLLRKNKELEQMNIELQKANKEREIAYEANERLEEMNKKLEKAYKYTAELKNKLEASNKYKTAFISNISHELRTPLNSIILLSELLMEDYSDCKDNFFDKCMKQSPENAKRAEIIYHSGNDLLELINDILDLSKIEAGKMNIHTEEFNLLEFITEMKERFNHMTENKNILFEFVNELETDSSFIKTDKGKLAQILKNFISNAFKFTEEGEVKIILSYSGNPEKPYMITVKDTGIGIKEDEQKLIFESFIQLDYSNMRKFKGTGLGLPISKQLAKLLSGSIIIDSTYGKGSSFSLIIPEKINDNEVILGQFEDNKYHQILENQNFMNIDLVESDEADFNDKSSLLKGKKILYAEVDPVEMFSYTSILEAHEAETIMVYDSDNVFNVLDNEQVDIIIIDMAVTGNAGYDITKRIREHPKYKNTSIIISSKEDNEAYQYKLEQLNADLYIKKPISPKDFIDNILSIVNYQ